MCLAIGGMREAFVVYLYAARIPILISADMGFCHCIPLLFANLFRRRVFIHALAQVTICYSAVCLSSGKILSSIVQRWYHLIVSIGIHSLDLGIYNLIDHDGIQLDPQSFRRWGEPALWYW